MLDIDPDPAFQATLRALYAAPTRAERLRVFAAFPEIEPPKPPARREQVGRHVVRQFFFNLVEHGHEDPERVGLAGLKITDWMMCHFREVVETSDVLDVLVPYLDHPHRFVRELAEDIIIVGGGFKYESHDDWYRKEFEHPPDYFRNNGKMDAAAPDFPWEFVRMLYAHDPQAAANTMLMTFGPTATPRPNIGQTLNVIERIELERRLAARQTSLPGREVVADSDALALLEWLSHSPHWFVRLYVVTVMMPMEPGKLHWAQPQVLQRLAEDDVQIIRERASRLLELLEAPSESER